MENVMFIDTHVVVWLYMGKTELFSKKAIKKLSENYLYISPIVKLELRYLFEIGKISERPEIIINTLQKDIGLLELDEKYTEIVDEAINQSWTRDPFDRLITAHANIRNYDLLTKDRTILSNCDLAFWE